jgi:hypothetical protein
VFELKTCSQAGRSPCWNLDFDGKLTCIDFTEASENGFEQETSQDS